MLIWKRLFLSVFNLPKKHCAQVMEGSTGNSKNVPKKRNQVGQNDGLSAVHVAALVRT